MMSIKDYPELQPFSSLIRGESYYEVIENLNEDITNSKIPEFRKYNPWLKPVKDFCKEETKQFLDILGMQDFIQVTSLGFRCKGICNLSTDVYNFYMELIKANKSDVGVFGGISDVAVSRNVITYAVDDIQQETYTYRNLSKEDKILYKNHIEKILCRRSIIKIEKLGEIKKYFNINNNQTSNVMLLRAAESLGYDKKDITKAILMSDRKINFGVKSFKLYLEELLSVDNVILSLFYNMIRITDTNKKTRELVLNGVYLFTTGFYRFLYELDRSLIDKYLKENKEKIIQYIWLYNDSLDLELSIIANIHSNIISYDNSKISLVAIYF